MEDNGGYWGRYWAAGGAWWTVRTRRLEAAEWEQGRAEEEGWRRRSEAGARGGSPGAACARGRDGSVRAGAAASATA